MKKEWNRSGLTSTQRGYGYKWQKARSHYLAKHPLCVFCTKQGRVTAADVVDHIKPHRGDMKLFWDRKNWQALCSSCHNSVKAQIEKSGYFKGCDENGIPLDSSHHWNLKG